MAEDKLAELTKWYKDPALIQIYDYHKPTEPIHEWLQSAPRLIPHRGLKPVLGVDAAFSFNRKELILDKASAGELSLNTLRLALVHCLCHSIKGKIEAHGDKWKDAYITISGPGALGLKPDLSMMEFSNKNLRDDCEEWFQQKLDTLVKPRFPKKP
jgi:hypothetical protein